MSTKNPSERPRRRWRWVLVLLVAAIVIPLGLLLIPRPVLTSQPIPVDVSARTTEPLRPVSSFDAITDLRERSIALFVEAGRVIQHPRCMNCHPRTDQPTQTEALQQHMPPVTRGADGGGGPLMRCSTCHQSENFEASGAPGNPNWKLAPIDMAWQGKTLGEICRQIQDPKRGGMTPEELHHHMAEDDLVGWAWHPGSDRAPPPGTQTEFGAIILAWLDTGASCPT